MIMAEFEPVENLLGSSGAAHLFEVAALCSTCPIDEIAEQISHQLPASRVASVKEAVEQRQATVERFSLFAMATGGILALTGILLVSLTAAAQAREKFWEIALLRSIGFRRSKLLVWLSSQSALAALLPVCPASCQVANRNG